MVSCSLCIRSRKRLLSFVTVVIVFSLFLIFMKHQCHINANLTSRIICNNPDDNPGYFSYNTTRVITPIDFKTLVENETICKSAAPFLMVLILTYHGQTKLREGIRSTWGQSVLTNNWTGSPLRHSVKFLFLMGVNKNPQWNLNVKNEASQYGDILVFNVGESYYNITNKVLLGFQWLQMNCPDVKYIMKIDIDIFVHIPRILERLDNPKWNQRIYGFYSENEDVVIKGKNANNFTIYPFYHFPPHVKGGLYVMSFSIAMQILKASKYFIQSNIEDVFITGILARVIGLGRYMYIDFTKLEYHRELPKSTCYFITNKMAIGSTYTSPKLYKDIWENILNPTLCTTPVKD